ncbi:MAG: phage gp6-like head-tail connector protein [Bacteroidales bacterium]|nr:phage gp6-like head-tail connector protein [Bacteroidales bacterium]
MSRTDLQLLKKHVRADDFTSDDIYLQHLLDAAEESVVGMTNRTLDDLLEEGDGDLPFRLRQAVLLLAGHWYNQREAVSGVQMHSVPFALDALVKPFRKLSSP